ncbi:calcium-binding protein [Stenotrophomonas acidaminiphila]|uniref:calcium-binding protein n=1 Tax=Stenotrophomonas acidaminiphila TaxID=128780 RepID=UPI0028A8B01A|nr:calcium-binding protein [Stenotrophomonas acidaminiphila]
MVTTIYLIADEIDPFEGDEVTPEWDDRAYLQAFVATFAADVLSNDYPMAEVLLTPSSQYASATNEELKKAAAYISMRAKTDPEVAAKLAEASKVREFVARYGQIAAETMTPEAASSAMYLSLKYQQKIDEANALMRGADVIADALRGVAKMARITGKIFGPLGYILPVAEGAYEGVPDEAVKGFAAALVGGVIFTGLTVLMGVPALISAGALTTAALAVVIAASLAYGASQIAESVWENGLGDQFWSLMDDLGWTDTLESSLEYAGQKLRMWFPSSTTPEHPDVKVEWVHSGSVSARGSGINIVEGNGGINEVVFSKGTTVASGGGGSDIYDVRIPDVSGNQVVNDDGSSDVLRVNGLRFGNTEFFKIGDGVFSSSGGLYRVVLVSSASGDSLVIKHKDHDATITLLNWSAGDFGINLPGQVLPPDPGVPLSSQDDVFGLFGDGNTNAGVDVVNAGAGNDGLSGAGGDDSLDGGAGHDLIFGATGNDKLYGGDGNDYIVDGTERVEFMEEWDDEEIVKNGMTSKQYYENEIARLGAAVLVRGRTWYVIETEGGLGFGGFETDVDPSGKYEMLDPNVYPSGDDIIDAGSGDDNVRSGEGDDIVVGGDGNDTLNGGHDDDFLAGGDGDDIIYGDASEHGLAGVHFSHLVSNSADKNGNDLIDAGSGNDHVVGGGGNDVIHGGSGNDSLMGRGEDRAVDEDDADSDYIDGGDGDDLITGNDGNDILLGGDGADQIRGDQETDLTRSGNDRIDGGGGNDVLHGDGGDDIMLGGGGADHILGDSLTLPGEKHGDDNISGGDGDDVIAGLGGSDVLTGNDGDDQLMGDASDADLASTYHGDDQLFGGAGNDLLWGGGGSDVLHGDIGNDHMDGGEGEDSLLGGEDHDQLFGGLGNDNLSGQNGDDILQGGEGNDSLSGGAGTDTLDGGIGDDLLNGNSGDDIIQGGDGSDSLYGQEGDDVLHGGSGDDLLNGGAGNDVLTGAQGNDHYVFDLGWGVDIIQGLAAVDAGNDVVVFGSGIRADDLEVAVGTAGSVILSIIGGTDRLTLEGVLVNVNADFRIEFDDGTTWSRDALFARLNATSGGLIGDSDENIIIAEQSTDNVDIYGGLGDDILIGGQGSDTIFGGNGNSEIGSSIGMDDDIIIAGAGSDTVYAEGGDDIVDAGGGNDTIYGGDGADYIFGREGDDKLNAGGSRAVADIVFHETADDFLVGGEGNDEMSAGLGMNTYYFETGFGQDVIYLTQVSAYETSYLGLNSEHAVLRFGGGISAEDIIVERSGDDIVVKHGADLITIKGYGGNRGTSVGFIFDDGSNLSVQQLDVLAHIVGTPAGETLSGTNSDDVIEGGGGNDTLVGNAGDDLLMGGFGQDFLDGGAGSDTYRYGLGDGVDVIRSEDVSGYDVLEFGAGILRNEVTFHKRSLSSGYDELYIIIAATGSYIKMIIASAQIDQAIDLIRFADGTAMTVADAVAASIPMALQLSFSATAESTLLTANNLSNEIYGGSNWATILAGGLGDDIYYIEERTFGRDGKPFENEGEGSDTVVVDFYDYVLPENIENLITRYVNYWTPGRPRNLVGNSLDNVIDSSAASSGNGWHGVIRLDGGAGADLMIGSAVDDIYVIDDKEDQIHEPEASVSIDSVEASISYSISNSILIENIILTGDRNTAATGNDLANRLDGFSSTGANTLAGGSGDDMYIVDASDVVIEHPGGGIDTVEFHGTASVPITVSLAGNVENGTLGSYINLIGLIGNGQNNALKGNSENNVLDGGAGDDTLEGGSGSDTYYIDSVGDVVIDVAGVSDRVISSLDSYTMGAGIEEVELIGGGVTAIGRDLHGDLMLGSESANRLFGMGGGDEIEGGGGDDQIDGGAGNDLVYGDGGNDILFGADGDDRLFGGDGVDTLDGGIGLDLLYGGMGNDVLYGGDGSDSLLGENGHDTLRGGNGDDYLDAGDGNDVLEGGEGGDSLLGESGDDILHGGNGDDSLSGGDGNDILEGGIGADFLYGGNGADTYYYRIGDGSDSIADYGADDSGLIRDVLHFGPGVDASDVTVYRSVRRGVTWVDINSEMISLIGIEAIQFNNGVVLDVDSTAIEFNDPPETTGDMDQPAFLGGPFNWVIPIESFRDEDVLVYSIIDKPNWLAYDSLSKSFNGSLPANPASSYSITVRATDSAGQWIDLTVNIPVLASILGDGSANTLNGTAVAEGLFGLAGNDTINGGGGDDYLYGGAGDDRYIIDAYSDDIVVEFAGEGNDTVSASVSYALTANIENLVLTGSSEAWGEGNVLDNTITGNNGVNELYGGAGNDTLLGNGGADYLDGEDGNDILDGGSGSDEMHGGAGDDTYIVDLFDQVEEMPNQGVDTVQSSVAWVLADNFENLLLTGSSSISGRGNSLDNSITGNAGANALYGYEGSDKLDGGAGNDTMVGGIGDDTYIVNASGDVVTEQADEGLDQVWSSISYTLGAHVENMKLLGTSAISGVGNSLDNAMVGNSGNNALSGAAGNDTLEGGAGTDTLTGGPGADTYLHARGYGADTVVENDAAANVDVAKFLSGVGYDQLWFARPSGTNNLEISIIGTTDKLTIKDWYLGAQYRVEEIRMVDGDYLLTAGNVQSLVNKMETIAKPTTTTLTSAQRDQLNSVFATTWVQQAVSASSMANAMGPEAQGTTPIAGILQGTADHGVVMAEVDVLKTQNDRIEWWREHKPDRILRPYFADWLEVREMPPIDWLEGMEEKFPISTPAVVQPIEDFVGYGLNLEPDQIMVDDIYDQKDTRSLLSLQQLQFEVESAYAGIADCQYLISVMALQTARLAPLEERQLARQQYPELTTMF